MPLTVAQRTVPQIMSTSDHLEREAVEGREVGEIVGGVGDQPEQRAEDDGGPRLCVSTAGQTARTMIPTTKIR